MISAITIRMIKTLVLPFFFAGMLLGSKLYHRMNQATFVKLTYVLLFISGVILLFK